MSNRDIFVHQGQQAEIKVDTFPFTRCDLLHGKVLSVSPDAPSRAPRAAPVTQGTGARLRCPCLTRPHADADRPQPSQLNPRHNRHRRNQDWVASLISYLLSPLVRYMHESLRER
jgi:hemolysin D